VKASARTASPPTTAWDDEQASGSRLLLRRRTRSPAPRSRSRSLPDWTKARARPATRAVARSGELPPLLLRPVVHVVGWRGIVRSCAGAVTHRAPATPRRSPLPSSASSGHGDTARHDLRVYPLRTRSSRAQRSFSRCRGGAGRWAIRWAKPFRIGPYQAQRRASTVATSWADLQVFLCLKRQRTPCFTRERTLVRNQPRPSKVSD
jgi:hypothetical protein